MKLPRLNLLINQLKHMFQKVSKRKYSIMKLYCYSALEIWNSGRLHETQNEIALRHEENFSFHCGRFWSIFVFMKSSDARMFLISIRGSVYITVITQNEIEFLSKWPQWNKNCSEFPFTVFQVNSYRTLTRNRIETISFSSKQNLIQTPSNWLCKQ